MTGVERIAVAAAALVAVVVLVVFPSFTVDDAFILFRYAENLADHGELNWNVGEDPVEGYTGVALVFLLAGLRELGLPTLLASKLIGIASAFIVAVVLYAFARTLALSEWVRAAIVLLFAGAPFVYTNAVSGLETMLFTASIITAVYLLYLSLGADARVDWLHPLLMLSLLFCALTRPEGAALAGLSVSAVLIVASRQGAKLLRRAALAALGLLVLPGAVYFVARWLYYGQLLPNTFYAKQSSFNMGSAGALEDFILFTFAAPILLAAALFVADADRAWEILRQQAAHRSLRMFVTAVVSTLFVLIVFTLYLRTDLKMNFSYRFFVPFMPLLLLHIAVVVDLGWAAIRDSRQARPLRATCAIILIVFFFASQAVIYARGYPDEFRYASSYGQMIEDEHVSVGKWLRRNVPGTEWLVVVADAGASPYYSGLKTVDFGELNDEVIRTLSAEDRVDYFFSFNPGAAVFSSYNESGLHENKKATLITADPRFSRYVLVKKYRSDAREFYQFLYVRRDLLGDVSGH